MTITEEIFQHYCSTATSPTGYGVLAFVQRSIDAAKGALLGLLGLRLYQKMEDIDLAPADTTDAEWGG